jgi:hypothetical protein
MVPVCWQRLSDPATRHARGIHDSSDQMVRRRQYFWTTATSDSRELLA